jgi:hypothetical protein
MNPGVVCSRYLFDIDWAVQNKKLEAVRYILENFVVDVLQKNSFGKSVLTESFQSGDTDVIAICLTHSSATEERLLSPDDSNPSADGEAFKVSSETAEDDGDNSVVHRFQFATTLLDSNLSDTSSGEPITPSQPGLELLIRELPISRADNPFGNDQAPQDDTTGDSHLLLFSDDIAIL